ncbi:MAG: hypothetical protein V3S55_00200 [Nitrospiraceae bacterium]
MSVEQKSLRRVSAIPRHGVGLSEEVYSPDLLEWLAALEAHDLKYGYLEVCKGSSAALATIRRRRPSALLAYHAKGVWVTQPDLEPDAPVESELSTGASHVNPDPKKARARNHKKMAMPSRSLSFPTGRR